MANITGLIGKLQLRDDDEVDECNPTGEDRDSYNLNLRIISVFVLLIVSLVGASLAVVSTRMKCCSFWPVIMNVGKFFGTGVILATGFIHMLPAATESLTDSCLLDGWHDYEAYATLFAMLAILAMQLIEFIAHHQLHQATDKVNAKPIEESASTPSVERCEEGGHSHGLSLLHESGNHKVSTYLLEFGVALHSVLIGVALGTTNGSTFVALFIALCFHQFFEAIALGAQISKLQHKSIIPAIFLIIFFTLTTPVGIAIGIGIIYGTEYNPKAVSTLLVNGILDSVAAGILIYVALVNLMAGEMGVGAHGFFNLKKRYKCLYFIALYLGAGGMAVIGRWA